MKIKPMVSFMILLVLASCQEEDVKEKNINELGFQTFQSEWNTSSLKSNIVKNNKKACYLFSGEKVNDLLNNPETHTFRFVLGLTNNKLDLKTQSVDRSGKNVGWINSSLYSDKVFDNALERLSDSNHEFSVDNSSAGQHLLESSKAVGYIQQWNRKLSENEDLTSVVSFDNQRIRYFSIEKEVVNDIAHFNSFKYLGIFLGINPEGKLTTILVGFDGNENIILPSSSGNENNAGAVYDFTRPCPNTCR